MLPAKRWTGRKRRVGEVQVWRQRRHSRGELVQWDTSTHAWLEKRGPTIYLIHMIDDASSELTACFVGHDSTEENLRLVQRYVEKHGRPIAFYTHKASLFQTAPKTARDQTQWPRDERDPLPPTQIGRALRELNITWIPAHSPQAKGRVERRFQTAQDRLVKGRRVAEARAPRAPLPLRELVPNAAQGGRTRQALRSPACSPACSPLCSARWARTCRSRTHGLASCCHQLHAHKRHTQRLNPDRRAKCARGLRVFKCKASAREFHQQALRPVSRSGGLAPTASGANSVASALHQPKGRDPFRPPSP
jgi:hypothetical protein